MAPLVMFLGNPLLDLTLPVDDKFLKQHNLELDSVGLTDAAGAKKLWDEIKNNPNLQKSAGGGALNTCRIFKVLKKCVNVHYFGAVGEDESANILRNLLNKNDIDFTFQTVPDYPTGQCFCFVRRDKTALLAHVGATAKFNSAEFEKLLANSAFLSPQKKQVFVIEGFVVMNCADSCRFLVDNYRTKNMKYVFTLSALYIIQNFTETVQYLVHRATFVFGRLTEFMELARTFGCGQDLQLLTQKLAGNAMKVFVVTDSANDIQVFTSRKGRASRVRRYPVPKVNPKMMKDTIGCGDSFASGFLSAYVEGCKLDQCVMAGTVTAQKVLTQIGCRLPKQKCKSKKSFAI